MRVSELVDWVAATVRVWLCSYRTETVTLNPSAEHGVMCPPYRRARVFSLRYLDNMPPPLPPTQKQTEEEEEYIREQQRYEQEAREAQDKF